MRASGSGSSDLLRPSRREAIAALAGLPALSALLAALGACGERKARGLELPGEIVGGDAAHGHLLRTGELLVRPSSRPERVGTAILGAGVAGLSAAWRLARSGVTDFSIYELEGEIGGNARSGENAVSRYPWAAHYVPVPVGRNGALEALLEEAGALAGRGEDGAPEWAEEVLVREPEERLFFRGGWHEGLYPRIGASRKDLVELARFGERMHGFAAARDAKGRRAFALPRRLSSPDAEFASLDRLSMAEWMERNGFSSPRLLWFAEYGCRDDFGSGLSETSAWAGIHYYAARLMGESLEDDPSPFLTWPEGNGRLVKTLAKAAAGRLVTSALVFDAGPAPNGRGVSVRYLDARVGEVVAVEAEDAVFALPQYVAAGVIAPWRNAPPPHLSAFEYVPWLVANVTLSARPAARGFPLAWDNVLFDSKSLGYVVATHQAGADHGPTVLTWYHAFANEAPAAARKKLLSASWRELADFALADLARAHPDLPALVTRVDLYRWGHAMARPRPGFVFGEALEAAARPLGRIRFAHADLSGLPLFEEAQDAGIRAAESILRGRRVPFAPMGAA